ncbi:MAG: phage fiber-tail adaptor protein [Candidatus Methanospirareceae archaeon]
MLVPDRLIKQPSEREYITVEFANRLPEGDSIIDITECKCYDGDIDVTTEMIEAPVVDASTNVVFWLRGGEAGKTYQITVKIQSEKGYKIEEDLTLLIRERGHA